jgi:Flp pilus assembly protein TadD
MNTHSPRLWHFGLVSSIALSGVVILTGCTAGGAAPTATPIAISTSLAKSIVSLLKTGIAQGEAGNTAGASATFGNVLLLDPGNQYAYFDLGVIAQSAHDNVAALSDYNKALKTNPVFTSALYNKAIILESSDPTQSVALYRQIVALNPKAATAYMRLSSLLDKQGDTAGAKSALASALKLDPTLSVPAPTPTATK